MQETLLKQEIYKGYTIEIHQDHDYEGPRGMGCDLGTMVCFHNRYDLGDKDHGMTLEDAQEMFTKPPKNVVLLPLHLYDHSGIRISAGNSQYPFNCPWDSGQVGFIYTTKDRIRKMYGIKYVTKKIHNRALQDLCMEVQCYNQWLSGDVIGYIITGPDGETFDSCWGYYETPDELMLDCKKAVTADLKSVGKQIPLFETQEISNGST